MAYGRILGPVGGDGLKIGDVVFDDMSADDKFLLCDGAVISQADYPALVGILPASGTDGLQLPEYCGQDAYIKVR